VTAKEVLGFSRVGDVEAVRDLLNLGDVKREFFNLRFIRHMSLQQISQNMSVSYSYASIARISAEVNAMLEELDL
jgi:hypothetical protein